MIDNKNRKLEVKFLNNLHEKNTITADMIEISLNGIDYLIYRCPNDRNRLYLDTYSCDPANKPYFDEITLYNGLLPVKRSIFGWIKNRYSDYKTYLYNVTVNRKAVKKLKDKLNNL